ncbi:MAG: ABC transporter substrate-binding protein [Candidatus Latescibacterota bacterium]
MSRPRLVIFAVILAILGVYWHSATKEASYRHNAPQLRAAACRENSTIDVAVMVSDENEKQFRAGVEMAVAEANNQRNPDGSMGLLVRNAKDRLVAKKIRCRYFKANSTKEAFKRASEVSHRFNYTAVLGHNTSDEVYPASLIYDEAGLLYICPFATSTRITSHNWPTIIRAVPTAKGFMSAVLENVSNLFGQKDEPVRLAVFSTNSIYSEDANTLLERYISENERIGAILDKTRKMIKDKKIPPDKPVFEWLKIDSEYNKSTLDPFDASDKLFLIQKMSHFGFTTPGIRPEDIDMERLQRTDYKLLFKELTVADVSAAIDTLRKLTPRVEIVHSARYRQNTKEFTHYTHMLSISNPDIILILDYLNDTSGELVKEIRQSGNNQPIIGDDGIEYPREIKEFLGDLAGDIYAISVYNDQAHGDILTRKFQEMSKYYPGKFKAIEPNYDTYQAYRSTALLVEAVAKCQSSDPLIIATRIKYGAGKGWIASSGTPLFFDGNGDVADPAFLLKKYNDGHFYLYQKKEQP